MNNSMSVSKIKKIYLAIILLFCSVVVSADVESDYKALQEDYEFASAQALLDKLQKDGISPCADLSKESEKQTMAVIDAAMSDFYYTEANYTSALETIEESLSKGKSLNNNDIVLNALGMKVTLLEALGNYSEAVAVASECLPLAEKDNSRIILFTTCYNLGKIYLRQHQYDMALRYIDRSLEYADDKSELADAYGLKGDVQKEKGDYNEAINSFNKCLDICNEIGDETFLALHQVQAATVYETIGDYAVAEELLTKGILVLEKTTMARDLAVAYRYLGSVLFSQKRSSEAIPYLEKAVELFYSLHDRMQVLNCYKSLAKVYLETDPRKAFDYRVQYDSLKDCMQVAKADSLMAQLNSDSQERTIERQKWQLSIGAIGAVALILIIIMTVAIRNSRKNRKHAAMLKVERDEATKARDEAQEARDEAVKANKLKDVFLENVVHELRTPINAIQGFNQLLSDVDYPPSEEERGEYMGYITDNCDLLITLVQDTLDVSRLESENYPVNVTDFSIKDACEKCIDKEKHRLQEGVELKVADDCEDFTVSSDHVLVERVLCNYISNACKYTATGSITVGYAKQGEGFKLTVTDTGCGIADENAEKVFNRFEKLGSYIQGNGIGLAIVALIAKILHGKAYMDTTYKEGGCRFVFEV